MREEHEYTAWWMETWRERNAAIEHCFGQTTPPKAVYPFTWNNPAIQIPGACAMRFSPLEQTRNFWLTMSLGLSQPWCPDKKASDWEFGLCSSKPCRWQIDLIFDLLTHFSESGDKVEPGYWLPLVFFGRPDGELTCGLTDKHTDGAIGRIRGLYVWPNYSLPKFDVSTGVFGIMGVFLVTAAEDSLAQEASPPHLLLLLMKSRWKSICDPFRSDLAADAEMMKLWGEVKSLSHDDAVKELGRSMVSLEEGQL